MNGWRLSAASAMAWLKVMDAKHVQAMVTGELKKRGFQGTAGSYSRDLTEGVSGFLGVTCNKQRDGTVSVWAVVGIRHEAIHARGVALGGYARLPTQPSLVVAMRYLGARGPVGEYHFTGSQESDQAELKRLVHDVSELSGAFYSELGTVDRALEAISTSRLKRLQNAEIFSPLAMLEQGRVSDALRAARKTLAGMDTRRGTGKQYAEFVEQLAKSVSE